MSTSVHQFFIEQLPGKLKVREADVLKSIPLDSVCGKDCRQAIQTAADFTAQIRKAHGTGTPVLENLVRSTALSIVLTFICG